MIKQNNSAMPKSCQKYGCAFVTLARYRELIPAGRLWSTEELSAAWTGAIKSGIVSGDLNGDGDMDDPGEATIQDWQQLVDYLRLPLQYLGKFPLGHPTTLGPDKYVLTAWINPANGFVHWVDGDKIPVTWDPIWPYSQTVLHGHPYQLQPDGRGGCRVFLKL